MAINPKTEFIQYVGESLHSSTFVRLTLSKYVGNEAGLRNLYAKPVEIKNKKLLSCTYRYTTKDIVKNYAAADFLQLVEQLVDADFRIATLLTLRHDIVGERRSTGFKLRKLPPSHAELPALQHDRTKQHKLSDTKTKAYLTLLQITDSRGNVLAKSQDKFRQINNFIDLLSPAIDESVPATPINAVDMGAGKGYLTFALYDYLTTVRNVAVDIMGVERRPELVQLCNSIAAKAGFEHLNFVCSDIADFDLHDINVLIALHACDTATDEAIAKGIKAGAAVIVVAPCCQHQIRHEMEACRQPNPLSAVTRYGIFLERQAELITDGLRTLLLELSGYKVKVVEFISDAHTHKNVMIIAQKTDHKPDSQHILQQIDELKNMFGIKNHRLQELLSEEK